jgi:hypothetical protein
MWIYEVGTTGTGQLRDKFCSLESKNYDQNESYVDTLWNKI